MEFFFNPKGIALIGASENPLKGGYAILKNLITGFKGKIYPVNPRYNKIEGITCYPSVSDVPDPVDLAIVFVPGKFVPKVVKDCAQRGIKGVMIEAGGFAETGAQGQAMQQELKGFAKKAGIRLWGPNCMGLVDAVNQKVFSFVSPAIWDYLTPGDVSLIVQSGMLSGAFLIDSMSHGFMGISKVCSIGNKMDVNECELLEYLISDPDTKVIGLYLESINEGIKFTQICAASPKPIVLLKGGKSAKGARAAMGHTASMAGDGAVIKGAMAQAGVIEAKDFRQMMDICKALAAYPEVKTKGNGRVAILTYTGGAGIVSSDFMDEMNLEPATLSPETKEMLKTVFPDWMPVSNPIDLWPAVEKNGAEAAYGTAIKAACADPEVDALFIHAFAGGFALSIDMDKMKALAGDAGKPIFCWIIGTCEETKDFQIKTQRTGIPVYRELYRAVECINSVFQRKTRLDLINSRRETRLDSIKPAKADTSQLENTAIELLNTSSGVLDEHISKNILAGFGIPTTCELPVTSLETAITTAGDKILFPLVMKGILPGSVHKTEKGLVKLGIDSREKLEAAYHELKKNMGDKGSILIQEHVEGSIELIAGLIRDPQFGACVMIGFGGIMAEILNDSVFGLAPLEPYQALDLIARLKNQKLLNGFRGAAAVDKDALAGILCALGRLGCECPGVREIDINPLIIRDGRPVAVDASIIME